jgi:Arc/MetJ-type ribon-helix-helix transcriptional regulator
MTSATIEPLHVQLFGRAAEIVRTQIAAGRHATANEVIDELVLLWGDQTTHDELEAAIELGLNSGNPVEVTPEFMAEKRRRLIEWYYQNEAAQ